eukprot:TRINITY_DN4418_c0_g1_i3.p1 TRINITY_DN4418_c0_g1~~TRINITY_DN4418_c0_g1_i3.p1  ORF type:complete len:445 (-),score=51.95 TRINITY_DN4418_c0_g1_i3:899-2233(-)
MPHAEGVGDGVTGGGGSDDRRGIRIPPLVALQEAEEANRRQAISDKRLVPLPPLDPSKPLQLGHLVTFVSYMKDSPSYDTLDVLDRSASECAQHGVTLLAYQPSLFGSTAFHANLSALEERHRGTLFIQWYDEFASHNYVRRTSLDRVDTPFVLFAENLAYCVRKGRKFSCLELLVRRAVGDMLAEVKDALEFSERIRQGGNVESGNTAQTRSGAANLLESLSREERQMWEDRSKTYRVWAPVVMEVCKGRPRRTHGMFSPRLDCASDPLLSHAEYQNSCGLKTGWLKSGQHDVHSGIGGFAQHYQEHMDSGLHYMEDHAYLIYAPFARTHRNILFNELIRSRYDYLHQAFSVLINGARIRPVPDAEYAFKFWCNSALEGFGWAMMRRNMLESIQSTAASLPLWGYEIWDDALQFARTSLRDYWGDGRQFSLNNTAPYASLSPS